MDRQGPVMDQATLFRSLAVIRESLHRMPDKDLQGAFAARLGVLQRALLTLHPGEVRVEDAMRTSKLVLDLRDEVLGAVRDGAA
jgi:hypothetical protein